MKIFVLLVLSLFLSLSIFTFPTEAANSKVESTFQVQPYELPNIIEYLSQQIYAAKHSVYMALYDFQSETMFDAVESALEQGVNFKVYADYEKSKDSESYLNQLIENYPDQIQVSFDSWKVHAKFMVIDHKHLLLGSANLEDDEPDNIEFLFSSTETTLVKKAIKDFEHVFPNKWKTIAPPADDTEDDDDDEDDEDDDDDDKRSIQVKAVGSPRTASLRAPPSSFKGNTRTALWFERGVDGEILKLIQKSKHLIDGALYKFTNEIFYDALHEAAERGVKIMLYLDAEENDYENSYSNMLESSFNDVNRVNITYSEENKVHSKFAVIDKEILVMGSANWSPGVESNLESIIITSEDHLINAARESLRLIFENTP